MNHGICWGLTNLAEFTDVADSLALERTEVLSDSVALQVDKTGERLIEQRANRSDREVTGFGLFPVSILSFRPGTENTHSKGVNHSLEAHINLAAANDLSDIGGVVGLKESNLEVLFLEETLGLSQIQGGVVRRGVP